MKTVSCFDVMIISSNRVEYLLLIPRSAIFNIQSESIFQILFLAALEYLAEFKGSILLYGLYYMYYN